MFDELDHERQLNVNLEKENDKLRAEIHHLLKKITHARMVLDGIDWSKEK